MAAADVAGGARGGGGAQPVVVAKVTQKDVPVDIAAVGNVEAYTTIAVRSQVTGMLEQVGIHEGDFVKKGELLFTIDQRPLNPRWNRRKPTSCAIRRCSPRPRRSSRATRPTPNTSSSVPSVRHNS